MNYPQFSQTAYWSVMDDFDPNWVNTPGLENKSWNNELTPLHETTKVPDQMLIGVAEDYRSIWFVDLETDRTWLSFILPDTGECPLAMTGIDVDTRIMSVSFKNGCIFASVGNSALTASGVYILDLIQDTAFLFLSTGTYQYIGRLRDESETWIEVSGAVAGLKAGNVLDKCNVVSGMEASLAAWIVNAGAPPYDVNMLFYKGVDSYAASFSDATFSPLGTVFDPSSGKCGIIGTEAVGGNFEVLAFDHIKDIPSEMELKVANASNVFGFPGDLTAGLEDVRLHGSSLLPDDMLSGGGAIEQWRTTSLFESELCFCANSISSSKITVLKTLKSGSMVSRNLDVHAFRPFALFGLGDGLGGDWMWTQFGTTSTKFLRHFNPYSSWLWNDGTSDITPAVRTLTLVAAPVWSAVNGLPLNGATQYGYAAVPIPLSEDGFTIFANIHNINNAGTIISMYEEGAAPATSKKMFRLYTDASFRICFEVWDAVVTQTGIAACIKRMTNALGGAYPITRELNVIAIYRGKGSGSEDSMEIWLNGSRADDIDGSTNFASFNALSLVSGVNLVIGADYAIAPAFAHPFGTDGLKQVGIIYGAVGREAIARLYEKSNPYVFNEAGMTGSTSLMSKAVAATGNPVDLWSESSDGPCNDYVNFAIASDAFFSVLGTVPEVDATTGLYVSFWINPSAFLLQQTLLSKTAAAYEIALGGIAAGAADNHIHVQLNGVGLGAGSDLISSVAMVAGNWYHVAFYYDTTFGEAQLFVNGQVDTDTYAVPITSVGAAPLVVGARAAGTRKYSGSFCGLRVRSNPPTLNGKELAEMVRLEYIDGLSNMGAARRFATCEPMTMSGDTKYPYLIQGYYAYAVDTDGNITQEYTVPQADRATKQFSTILQTEEGNVTFIYSDGTRTTTAIKEYTDAEKLAAATRRAVSKAIQRDNADKISYYATDIDIVLELPLPIEMIVTVDATSSDVHVQLPTVFASKGKKVTIKKTDVSANFAIMDVYAVGETIDGAGFAQTNIQWEALTAYSDGKQWLLV